MRLPWRQRAVPRWGKVRRPRGLLPKLLWYAVGTLLLCGVPILLVLAVPARRPAAPTPPGLSEAQNPMITLYDDDTHAFSRLPLEQYLVGVVAGEMPASFESAALQAQAIASRTYTVAHLRSRGGEGCTAHPPADACTDPGESQAWLSPTALRRKWKPGDYDVNLGKIEAAVRATGGLVAVYGGKPIDAVYFAASGGRTEDARYVWGHAVPYLQSVPSPGETDPYEHVTTRLSWPEVAARLGLPTDEVERQPAAARFRIVAHTPSGRAERISVAGTMFAATDVRRKLGLRSTWITAVQGTQTGLTLQTKGWGHGVGLSQWGAEAMAQRGATARQIILWYYRGVSVEPLASLGQ